VGVRINLAIALSGARLDLGEAQLALEELEIAELSPKTVFPQSPLLFSSYAEVLRELGRNGDDWDQLAERASKALANVDGEVFELVEEIKIPTSEEFDRTAKKPFEKKPFDKKPYDRKPSEKKPYEKKPFDKKPFDKDRKPRTSDGKFSGGAKGRDFGKGRDSGSGRSRGNASR